MDILDSLVKENNNKNPCTIKVHLLNRETVKGL